MTTEVTVYILNHDEIALMGIHNCSKLYSFTKYLISTYSIEIELKKKSYIIQYSQIPQASNDVHSVV